MYLLVPCYLFANWYLCCFPRVCEGITQDRIDECRGAKEAAMLADIRALLQNKADLNAQDNNGATLVRLRDTFKLSTQCAATKM